MSATAASEVAFLARALKAPRIRERASALAERARDGAWSYEEYLAAVLSEEVAAREGHGGEARVKAAHLPAVKTLDDFDFGFARGLKRETVLHLAQLDFLAEHKNVIFLGPPGTDKTHCETRSCDSLRRNREWIGRLPLIVVDEVGFHPLRPRGGGALLRPRQLPLRAQLDHRELEQDLLGLDGRASATR